MKTADIYVILNNGQEVYVGFSTDIAKRWVAYKCSYVNPNMPSWHEKVTQYMVKHGWYNHSIELVEEDVPVIGIKKRIEYWVSAYELIGCTMINRAETDVKREVKYKYIICDRCNKSVKHVDKQRHWRTTRCKLAYLGFGEVPKSRAPLSGKND
tara:strand:- start:419 stop:880 length:462 start_codon:yes stop_codon:yes gene_type:complete